MLPKLIAEDDSEQTTSKTRACDFIIFLVLLLPRFGKDGAFNQSVIISSHSHVVKVELEQACQTPQKNSPS